MKIGRYLSVVGISLLAVACAPRVDYRPPFTAQSHYVLGLYAKERDQFSEALSYFDQAIEEAPDEPAVLSSAFSLAFMVGDMPRLVRYGKMQQALTGEGQTSNLSAMALAIDAFQRGDLAALPTYYDQFKGSGFEGFVVPIMKAWAAAMAGNKEEAKTALKAMIDANKSLGPLYLEQSAYIYDYLGEEAIASQLYRELIQKKLLRNMQPVVGLAELLYRSDNPADGEKVYAVYRGVVPDNLTLQQAEAYHNKGSKQKVPGHVSPGQSPIRAMAVTFLMAATELSSNKDYRSAAILYARFATLLDPTLYEAKIILGNLFMVEERYHAALRVFDSVTGDGAFAEEAQIRYALTLSQLGQVQAAEARLQNAVQRQPHNEAVLQALGNLYQDQSNFAAAAKYYSAVLDKKVEISSADWFMLFTRGIAYERSGQWPLAEKDLLAALGLRPNDPQVLNYLGYSWIDRGENLTKAHAMLEKAVSLGPENGLIVDSLGWAEYKLGNYSVALGHLQKAVALEPGDSTLNEHLGDVFWQLGRHIEARFQWQHALDLGPDAKDVAGLKHKLVHGLPVVRQDRS